MELFEKINTYVKDNLYEKRYIHTLGVVKMAKELGNKYGADTYKLSIAAILHDAAKPLKDEELIARAEKYGIQLDYASKHMPQLLHGPVAAELGKELFSISDIEIYNSVYYHTTGRSGMSLYEKIIYMADMIEEGRKFEGVDDLRKLTFKNIDEALLKASTDTLIYVLERKLLIHPLTIEMRNSLIMQTPR